MLDALIQSPHILLFSLDHALVLRHISPAAEAFMGKSMARLAEINAKTLFDKAPEIYESLRGEGSYSFYNQYVTIFSSSDFFDVHIFSNANDRIVFLYPRSRVEIRERNSSTQAASLQASGMAAMLAHEIRNPLSAIRGAAQLISDHNKEDQAMLAVIEEETARIGRLVGEFEEMAAMKPAPISAVNIHNVLDQARRAALAGFASHINIIENYDPSLPLIAANDDRLQAALHNLVKNAAEAINQRFQDAKGRGMIRLSTRYQRGVRRKEELPVELSIRDNGGGIKGDLIADIFKPFVTSKANGTGLGLAMVARAVEDFGGLIEVYNIGDGCEFILRLPLWKEK